VFKPLTASISASMAGIESGAIDQTAASMLPGNGTGTIHALYITANFYNVNYISQTNVLLNTDTVVQYLPHVAHNHAPTGAPTSSTETINSGTNQLANLASIATVGAASDFQFAGGQHYDDAILAPANLVEHKSQVTIGDAQTLAPRGRRFHRAAGCAAKRSRPISSASASDARRRKSPAGSLSRGYEPNFEQIKHWDSLASTGRGG